MCMKKKKADKKIGLGMYLAKYKVALFFYAFFVISAGVCGIFYTILLARSIDRVYESDISSDWCFGYGCVGKVVDLFCKSSLFVLFWKNYGRFKFRFGKAGIQIEFFDIQQS